MNLFNNRIGGRQTEHNKIILIGKIIQIGQKPNKARVLQTDKIYLHFKFLKTHYKLQKIRKGNISYKVIIRIVIIYLD